MSIPTEAIEAGARVAEFVRQYRMRTDVSPDGVIYSVWMDVDAEQAELRLDDLAALSAASPRIQAAALRDAAEVMVRVHEMENVPDGQGSDADEAAFADWDEASRGAWDDSDTAVRWLHARADQLEGKTK